MIYQTARENPCTQPAYDFVDMGADEAYSCDDEELTEDDIYNPDDSNSDGAVDVEDIYYFFEAWLSHDPNDDTIITDPNFSDDPNYVDHATLEYWRANWNSDCNLDKKGASEYRIDLADFAELQFRQWTACWRDGYVEAMSGMAMGGGESMMMIPMSMSLAMTEPEPESAELTEKQLAELVKGIYGIMSSLGESFDADDLTADELDGFIEFFGSILLDLQEEYLE